MEELRAEIQRIKAQTLGTQAEEAALAKQCKVAKARVQELDRRLEAARVEYRKWQAATPAGQPLRRHRKLERALRLTDD